MPNKIIPYTGQDLCAGDILVLKSPWVIIQHFAIVYKKDGSLHVADHKPVSHGARTMPLSEYLTKREVDCVVRSEKIMSLPDAYIQQRISDLSPLGYRLFTYNCEDFIRDICGCDIGYDQRKKFINILLIIIGAGLLIYILRKSFSA